LKKFIIILSIFFALFLGVSFFVNTTYFFNKYIASNIKEYGFNYKKVDGALLRGFRVEKLSYKNRPLSSEAELRFNPLKLIYKKLSISKLRLIDVDKETLEKIANDFKPKQDSSSSTNIALNFEINDILLTIKPFNIEDINISKNILKVDYIEYVNSKFNIGKVDYLANTTIGKINFIGRYEKRVLKIDNIELKDFNLKRFLPLLKLAQFDENSSSESNLSNPFIPKVVEVKRANLNLSPFKYKDISSKDLKISINSAKLNIEKLNLTNAKVALLYKSKLANIDTNIELKDKKLNIKNLNIDLKEPNIIEKIVNSYIPNSKNDSNSSIASIIYLNSINIEKAHFRAKSYRIKKETIDTLELEANRAMIDLNSSKLTIKDINFNTKSKLANLNLQASIDKKIVVESVSIKSNNLDKFIALFDTNSSKKETQTESSLIKLPKEFIVKKAIVDGKKLSFLPYYIDVGSVEGKNILGNIENFRLKSGNLSAKVDSNWGKANLDGIIKDNRYFAKGKCAISQKLLDRYSIPLIAKNIKPLKVDGWFGFDKLDINIDLKGNNILKPIDGVDILKSKNRLIYDYESGDTVWTINADVDSKYSGKAKLENKLTYYDKLLYKGKLTPKKKLDFAKKLGKVFDNLYLNYSGNSDKIDLDFETVKLKGILKSSSYKGGELTIVNKAPFVLKDIVDINSKYSNSVVSKVVIKAPIKFTKLLPLKGDINLHSNLINLVGKWQYNNSFSTKLISKIPANSILKKDMKNLNSKALSPLNLEITMPNNNINIKVKNSTIEGTAKYLKDSKKIDTSVNIGLLRLSAKGNIDSIKLLIKSKSIKQSLKSISKIYKIKDIPNIEGPLYLEANINRLEKAKILLKSAKVTYRNKKTSTKIENIVLNANYDNGSIVINNYKFKANNYSFYSSKPSKLYLKDDNLKINEFWINNSLRVNGLYNTKSAKGSLNLKSSNFTIDNNNMKLSLVVDTKMLINRDKKSISGSVDISGVIKKNLKQKNVADNEDIIILQRKAAKESTNFAKNIKLNIKLKSKNGITYSQGGSYFKLRPNIKVIKEYGKLSKFIGKIDIDRGGYYNLKGKKLVLQKGLITFKGSSSSPNLNIVMQYKGKEYKININISGTPTRPILYFSSNPPLTKDQILAYLLFDDSTASGTHSQEAMLNLIGGTLAKSFLGSIGIKLDHVSIKENGFSIGKSISDNVIIYYNQDGEKSSVKTRIDITNSIHTEIEVGGESQSADIIFSKEY